jgi:hypothetical protein
MKHLLSLAFIALAALALKAQESPLQNLLSAGQAYLDFRKQSVNDANGLKKQDEAALSKLNQAFMSYALSLKGRFDESNGYRSLPNNKLNTLFKATERLELNAMPFEANGMKLSFIGLNLHHGIVEVKNHVLINENTGTVVYLGNDNTCYVDWLAALDEQHVAYCMHHGELGTSRKVMVLNTSLKEWKIQQAFKGIQTRGPARGCFNLHASFEDLVGLPDKANRVYFDSNTKEIYYFKYLENKKVKVNAAWKNGQFQLDDYSMESNPDPTMVPVER